MNALNFFQNGGQVNQAIGLDKFVRLNMLMVRERLQLACARIEGIVIAKKDSTATTMIGSIKIFFNRNAFLSINFLKSRTLPFLNSLVPERKAISRVFLSMVSE